MGISGLGSLAKKDVLAFKQVVLLGDFNARVGSPVRLMM